MISIIKLIGSGEVKIEILSKLLDPKSKFEYNFTLEGPLGLTLHDCSFNRDIDFIKQDELVENSINIKIGHLIKNQALKTELINCIVEKSRENLSELRYNFMKNKQIKKN